MHSPRFFVLASALILAWGCQGEPASAPLVQAVSPAPVPGPDSPALAQQADDDDYHYNPIGRRDPYRPFFPTGPDPDACKDSGDPVQCFAVEQFRLTGVVWGERPRALLEDPEGGSYVVELGSYVGKYWGRVTHIESGSVVITEEYLTPDEQLVVQPIRLRLGPLG
jgi:type IV pilus assembly protein PilP